jgi:hypothetical protein
MAKASASTKSLTVEMNFDHDTKGAVQFKEGPQPGGARPPIGTLYMTKVALNEMGGNFKKIRVTVEPVG